MTAPAQAPIVQGWCPGALRPMLSGDGLVVRVRLPPTHALWARNRNCASAASDLTASMVATRSCVRA